MKERKLYWRRKGDRIILEGKGKKSRTIYLWTLPTPSKFIEEILLKSSYLPEEKLEKIKEKISRLEYREHKTSKMGLKVRTTNIMGTPEKDAFDAERELDELLGRFQ
jgi:hypothetical protein